MSDVLNYSKHIGVHNAHGVSIVILRQTTKIYNLTLVALCFLPLVTHPLADPIVHSLLHWSIENAWWSYEVFHICMYACYIPH